MANIDGPQVPILVDEEVNNVDSVKECGYQNRIGDAPVKLVLVCNEGEVTASILAFQISNHVHNLHQGPSNYAWATVSPEFEVKVSSESGVKFNTHVDVV